jgi:hypothetical protein
MNFFQRSSHNSVVSLWLFFFILFFHIWSRMLQRAHSRLKTANKEPLWIRLIIQFILDYSKIMMSYSWINTFVYKRLATSDSCINPGRHVITSFNINVVVYVVLCWVHLWNIPLQDIWVHPIRILGSTPYSAGGIFPDRDVFLFCSQS